MRHYLLSKKITMNSMPQDESMFGVQLRRARLSCKLSQENLAQLADVSPRHVSFLETGRARPSRDLIFRLGEVLSLSANRQNALLHLAGFAPAFAPDDLTPPERTLALEAVSKLLASQNPVPAIASDSLGYILQMNEAATLLLTLGDAAAPVAGDNLFELFFTNAVLRDQMTNWHEVAPALLYHLEQEALNAPDRMKASRLVTRLARLAGPAVVAAGSEIPIFRFEMTLGEERLCLVSNYSTFGTPYDATMQSIRIECFFPADEPTRRFLNSLVENGLGSARSAQ